MQKNETSDSIQKQRAMSFSAFLSDNYELNFTLPKKKPLDDSLNSSEIQKLRELMLEKDFYEINSIIRKKYFGK